MAQREGSTTQAIRDALAGGSMTVMELAAKIGADRKKVSDLCGYLLKSGEVSSMGRGEQRSIALGGAPRRKPARKKKAKAMRRARKGGAGKRAARRANGAALERMAEGRVYGKILDGLKQRAADQGRSKGHVATTLYVLESLIEIDEADEVVRQAFRAHKEAVELLAAS